MLLRPDRSRQSIVNSVGELECLGLIAKRLHGDDGAEDLLLHEFVLLAHSGDDRRCYEEAQLAYPMPSRAHCRMTGHAVEDAKQPFELVDVVHRPIERVG